MSFMQCVKAIYMVLRFDLVGVMLLQDDFNLLNLALEWTIFDLQENGHDARNFREDLSYDLVSVDFVLKMWST